MAVVYLASPIGTYYTELYEECRERVAALFPGAELICPPDGPLYPSARVFRATYRQHLARCTDLVAFSTGRVERGMAEEIRYARLLGKTVWWLDGDGKLKRLGGV